MNLVQQLERFEQRTQLYAGAALVDQAANDLAAIEPQATAEVNAELPQIVSTGIAAIEKADVAVPGAAFINGVLSAEETEIDAELAPLVAQGGALIPNIVTAMHTYATKCREKAATL